MSDEKQTPVDIAWTKKSSLPTSHDVLKKLYELRQVLIREQELAAEQLEAQMAEPLKNTGSKDQTLTSGTGTDG